MRPQLAALGVLFLAACSSNKSAPEEQLASDSADQGSKTDKSGDLAVVPDAGHPQDTGPSDAAPMGCACDTATSYCFKSCGGATSCGVFQEGCQSATSACRGSVTCGCLKDAGVVPNTGEYPCWVADGGVVTVAVFE